MPLSLTDLSVLAARAKVALSSSKNAYVFVFESGTDRRCRQVKSDQGLELIFYLRNRCVILQLSLAPCKPVRRQIDLWQIGSPSSRWKYFKQVWKIPYSSSYT